jgi:hypothetical protein
LGKILVFLKVIVESRPFFGPTIGPSFGDNCRAVFQRRLTIYLAAVQHAHSATDFVYDREADAYRCPGGKALKPYWRNFSEGRSEFGKDGFKKYFAQKRTTQPAN